MSPTLWSLVAGVTAVGLEWLYRVTPTTPFYRLLPLVLPGALLICYGIRILVLHSSSLVAAVIVYASVTAGARVAISLAMRDTISAGTWAALGLLLLSRVVMRLWP